MSCCNLQARIKRILAKYSQDVNLQSYISAFTAIFTIFFLVHLLTCFFYMVGRIDETMGKMDSLGFFLRCYARPPCANQSFIVAIRQWRGRAGLGDLG